MCITFFEDKLENIQRLWLYFIFNISNFKQANFTKHSVFQFTVYIFIVLSKTDVSYVFGCW